MTTLIFRPNTQTTGAIRRSLAGQPAEIDRHLGQRRWGPHAGEPWYDVRVGGWIFPAHASELEVVTA